MRRWLELGFNGDNPALPTYNFQSPGLWELNSRRRFEHRPSNAMFVSMPFKETLFDVLAALSVSQFTSFDLRPLLMGLTPVDQGVDPAPDCTALHVPRIYSFTTGGSNTPQIMPSIYTQFIGGFTVVDATGFITGGTAPIFDLENSPQTEN